MRKEVLLFRTHLKTGISPMNDSEVMSHNLDDPDAPLYSRLSELEKFRNPKDGGKFFFSLYYPEISSSPFLWKQTENPLKITGLYNIC